MKRVSDNHKDPGPVFAGDPRPPRPASCKMHSAKVRGLCHRANVFNLTLAGSLFSASCRSSLFPRCRKSRSSRASFSSCSKFPFPSTLRLHPSTSLRTSSGQALRRSLSRAKTRGSGQALRLHPSTSLRTSSGQAPHSVPNPPSLLDPDIAGRPRAWAPGSLIPALVQGQDARDPFRPLTDVFLDWVKDRLGRPGPVGAGWVSWEVHRMKKDKDKTKEQQRTGCR